MVPISKVIEYLEELSLDFQIHLKSVFDGISIDRPSSFQKSDKKSMIFLTDNFELKSDFNLNCGLLITSRNRIHSINYQIQLSVDNPRFVFAILCEKFFPAGIDSLENYDQKIKSKDSTCSFGVNSQIHSTVQFGKNIQIGKSVYIEAGVIIHSGTVIGDNSRISCNSVIGGTGFGFERFDKMVIRLPHYGAVTIGRDVEIGSNTTVNRGTLGDTQISDNVKIDCLVHVGHNVQIGRRSIVVAGSVLCGSSVIGEDCWIAPNAIVGEGRTLGKSVTVGYGALINRDVESNKVMVGNPARELIKKDES